MIMIHRIPAPEEFGSQAGLDEDVRLLDPMDPRSTLDFVSALIKVGANATTIHVWIVGGESHNAAQCPSLVEVTRQLKQTEGMIIAVNGNLYTMADIWEMKYSAEYNGVMLARPVLCSIPLFRKDHKTTRGSEMTRTLQKPSLGSKRPIMRDIMATTPPSCIHRPYFVQECRVGAPKSS